jgi:hypothetical protein
MAVMVHQRRFSGIDGDGKDANKHVLKHKVMAGFRSNFHGRLGLLGKGRQGKNTEQSHDRKFSHRKAILDVGRTNANENMRAGIKSQRRLDQFQDYGNPPGKPQRLKPTSSAALPQA